uniref:Uncharacterized protein n=1 Tax=Knipowitschia caucasica TaxID=637954 RepID=A0AAV2LVC4_KNICA
MWTLSELRREAEEKVRSKSHTQGSKLCERCVVDITNRCISVVQSVPGVRLQAPTGNDVAKEHHMIPSQVTLLGIELETRCLDTRKHLPQDNRRGPGAAALLYYPINQQGFHLAVNHLPLLRGSAISTLSLSSAFNCVTTLSAEKCAETLETAMPAPQLDAGVPPQERDKLSGKEAPPPGKAWGTPPTISAATASHATAPSVDENPQP